MEELFSEGQVVNEDNLREVLLLNVELRINNIGMFSEELALRWNKEKKEEFDQVFALERSKAIDSLRSKFAEINIGGAQSNKQGNMLFDVESQMSLVGIDAKNVDGVVDGINAYVIELLSYMDNLSNDKLFENINEDDSLWGDIEKYIVEAKVVVLELVNSIRVFSDKLVDVNVAWQKYNKEGKRD